LPDARGEGWGKRLVGGQTGGKPEGEKKVAERGGRNCKG